MRWLARGRTQGGCGRRCGRRRRRRIRRHLLRRRRRRRRRPRLSGARWCRIAISCLCAGRASARRTRMRGYCGTLTGSSASGCGRKRRRRRLRRMEAWVYQRTHRTRARRANTRMRRRGTRVAGWSRRSPPCSTHGHTHPIHSWTIHIIHRPSHRHTLHYILILFLFLFSSSYIPYSYIPSLFPPPLSLLFSLPSHLFLAVIILFYSHLQ
ncbi:hypothetical protein B0H19DRAFT_1151587 [Mycena capillaripes]|nr:hypothetical protein B0H19DRAFT_1151587 [Mycena capillaripes]